MIDNIKVNKLNPELWVANYADMLFSYAYKRVNDKYVAEDLVQETFFGGLKSQLNFAGDSTEKTWLFAILKFKIIDYYRKKSKEKTTSLNNSEGKEIDSIFFEADGHVNKNPEVDVHFNSSDSYIDKKEFYGVLEGCLSKIPKKLAQVFHLKMIVEEDSKVICEMLNITDANYWVILHRAKIQLRSCLFKNWIS
jgi:RNA polymerase sigma-70 factor (TIGR02943 family)